MKKITHNLAARFYMELQETQKQLDKARQDLQTEKKRVATLIEENAQLKEKLSSITQFHCYKVGKSVAEAKKSWGTVLGGMIGSWKYYSSVKKDKKSASHTK